MKKHPPAILLAAALLAAGIFPSTASLAAPVKNGFDLENAAIPPEEILQGGPPRDGIPAIHSPKFLPAEQADFLNPDDRVLALTLHGEAHAYPVRILDWHEIVNDKIGETSFAVTYCPLCGSGVVFRAEAGGKKLSFGVSGLLYKSDVLLYDRESESLWSQLLRRAVAGPLKGAGLESIPAVHTTWRDWKKRRPDTKVLSTETGHKRDYARSPYGDYDSSRALYFPVGPDAPRFHPKEPVLGVESGGAFKAYPFSELQKNGRAEFTDQVGGAVVTVAWNEEDYAAEMRAHPDAESLRLFWFAWFAFHPETEIFSAE